MPPPKSATLVLICVTATVCLTGRALSEPAPQQTLGDGFVASAEANRVLRRVREALGGVSRVVAVRTLLFKGVYVTPEDLLPGTTDPHEYRMQFPDAFQERSAYRGTWNTFTLSGQDYWQEVEPKPFDAARARETKLRTFADWSLLILTRAPAALKIQVGMASEQSPDVALLTFTGAAGYHRRIAYNRSSWQPMWLEYDWQSSGRSQTRRWAVSDFERSGGILVPRLVHDRMSAQGKPRRWEFTAVSVNEGVSAADFRRR
jgi:hypothetical protein